jgi:hypothetical protein
MAKRYRFYNDAETVDAEYITDGFLNHETFFITELRSVGATDVQAGLDLQIEGVTETYLETLANTLELNLEILNEDSQISDTKGGASILTYSFSEQLAAATIDDANKTIAITVVDDTDPSDLIATFTASDGATVDISDTEQESGTTENDFSSPVTYTVTSESGKEVEWTVTVTVQLLTGTNITAYSFAEQTGAATIDDEAQTVDIEVANGTTVTALVATFTLSKDATAAVGATPQVSATTANNFTSPVVYTITAEDGVTEQDWTITVTVAES